MEEILEPEDQVSIQTVSEEQGDGLETFVAAHLRRNFAALTLDLGAYGLGMTFASATTILPAFAEHLGASNLLIGAIPSVMTLGYALPPLFFANYTERLSRKLRFVLTYTVWERLPMLFLAVATFFLAERWPNLTLLALFLTILTITCVGGALIPAWMDLIGKVIPTHFRGRLFAFGGTFSAGLGLGGAALTGYFLQEYQFPLDYTLCFVAGFAFFLLSFFFLALIVEPEVPSVKPRVNLSIYLRRLPDILRGDRNFTWYLVHRAAGIFGAIANGFYTVFALRNLGAPEWRVAQFTFVLLAGQTIASLSFGVVADRLGHKPVLIAGMLALVIGNFLALTSNGVEQVYLVFLCMAIFLASNSVSALNISMEFAPEADRPTYVGLTSLLAPLTLFSSLIGGILADQAGYRAVFVVAGLAAAVSAVILIARVRDPRALAPVIGPRALLEE